MSNELNTSTAVAPRRERSSEWTTSALGSANVAAHCSLLTAYCSASWKLAPEGAAVHIDEKTAVIADVHLGYEWSRASGGDAIPPHSLAETVLKLERLLARAEITRLVVAGDLVESNAACSRTSRDVSHLSTWLGDREVELVQLMGNHDPVQKPALPSTLEIDGWTICHGHEKIAGRRLILGHHHPVLSAGSVTAPCFLVSSNTILLPAFSRNAAGSNVATGSLPRAFRGKSYRCYAGVGEELLDFGDVATLSRRLQRLGR
jgi:putative SbcD/Mre11-related phosphoesterase